MNVTKTVIGNDSGYKFTGENWCICINKSDNSINYYYGLGFVGWSYDDMTYHEMYMANELLELVKIVRDDNSM